MAEQKETKHHGSKKRPHRMELTFSDEEWNLLQKKAKESGEKSLTKFARKAIVNAGVVSAKVTEEDRKEIGKLKIIGVNLWQLRKQLHNEGIDEKTLNNLEVFYDEFAKIIKFYRGKIDKK